MNWTGRHSVPVAAALLALLAGCGAPRATLTRAPEPNLAIEAPPGLARSEPSTMDIPSIGAHSTLVPLGLNPDDTVQVPPVATPMQAGWYEYGPTPGEIGPAVLLGHVDGNKQPGIFYRLREVNIGDQIVITRQDGLTITFRVGRKEKTAKDSFPTDAVYGDTTEPELRLITCGGSFDRSTHNYRDNIIVFATMIS
jgi:sortase (surface protein transpeptidase)